MALEKSELSLEVVQSIIRINNACVDICAQTIFSMPEVEHFDGTLKKSWLKNENIISVFEQQFKEQTNQQNCPKFNNWGLLKKKISDVTWFIKKETQELISEQQVLEAEIKKSLDALHF
ncbi:uncharacterized protein [Euwallacea fornicatus]|uniref:uncharacterized protein n=1 Tax=Euwallacea fornicatus TaxID=995702 RepID=UPI00338D9FB7